MHAFERALLEHAGHREFRVTGDPIRRALGFYCHGVERQMPLTQFRSLSGAARTTWNEAYHRHVQDLRKAALIALKRSMRLFRRTLSPEQYAQYIETKTFDVRGADGRLYRIHLKDGVEPQVTLLEGLHQIAAYCVLSEVWVPGLDLALAEKLALEMHPEAFLTKAHLYKGSDPQHPEIQPHPGYPARPISVQP